MKNKIKSLIAILAAAAVLPAGAAESAPGKIWDLGDCMVYAIEHNFDARRKLIDQNDYKQNYINQFASHFPSLSAGGGGGFSFGRGVDPATNTYETTSNFGNSYSISGGMTLFNGFALINQTRAAKIARLSGAKEQQQVEDRIALGTMAAYVKVVYCKRLVELAHEQLTEKSEMLRQSRREMELGTKSFADVAQLEADAAGAEYEVITSENNLQVAVLELKDQMNYPIDDSLEVEPEMEQVPLYEEGQTPEDIFQAAAQLIPDIQIAKYALDQYELYYKATKAQMYPSFSMSGGISTNYFTDLDKEKRNKMAYFRALDTNLGESVGFSMSIPIFGNLGRRTQTYKARNSVTRSKIALEEKSREIRSEIEKAVMDLNSAEQKFTQAEKKVAATELAYRVTRRKFEEGLQTAIDLQASYNQMLTSRIEYAYSQLELIAKRRQVNYYKGVPLVSF